MDDPLEVQGVSGCSVEMKFGWERTSDIKCRLSLKTHWYKAHVEMVVKRGKVAQIRSDSSIYERLVRVLWDIRTSTINNDWSTKK